MRTPFEVNTASSDDELSDSMSQDFPTTQVAEHELTPSDREQLQALLADCFPEHLTQRIYYKQLPQFRLLIHENGDVVAQVGVEHRVIRVGDAVHRVFGVIDLATHSAHRGRGLAGALLERLEATAREYGVEFVILFADDQRLYERRGYVQADNTLKFLGIDEHQSVGVLERSLPEAFMVLEVGESRWLPGLVDLLGYLF
jgi:N-acetylglutamate synthase-like GNAT family acetyltransferase